MNETIQENKNLFDLKGLLDKRLERTEMSSQANGCGSIIEQNSAAPEFFGAREPQYVLQQERPEHRVICYLSAEGNTITEIADKTGFSKVMIGYVLKQPWAQKLIAEVIKKHGGDAVEIALKGAALDAAMHLINTFKDDKAPHNVRAMCAKETLDRVYGRSQQVVAHLNVTAEELTDEELAKAVTAGTGTNN